MLQTLKIENVALIDKAELTFDEKLNVISGETGAGKSIMLDALSFVFGGRSDKTLIRSGATSMKVEAIFSALSITDVEFIKQELGIDCKDEMFLMREIDLNGKNTCKINGELVPVASVKKVCLHLVDIHGQSEHLAILDNDYQLQIVDLFSKTAQKHLEVLNNYIYKVKEIETEIDALGGSEQEKQNLIDLYTYQIKEIEEAGIFEGEFEKLAEEKKTMQQFEKINENLRAFCETCGKNSFGETALEKLNMAKKNLQNISDINEQYKALENRVESAILEVEDIVDTAYENLQKNVFDEEHFNYIDGRVDLIKSLFRKYGGNFENLTEYHNQTEQKLQNLINGAERYAELSKEKENLLAKIDEVQIVLTKERKLASQNLSAKLQQELQTLGMPNAKMEIAFDKITERYSRTGVDKVEFMFSSNLGFELKPLNKVVSGGEMSRVMLAYKIVVSAVDNIHTIVFDEIDTGLSGNIAMVVAEYMARLSKNKQIIAVSHLPQICAMADYNLKVEKYSDATTTHTKATVLTGENLYLEITRLMGAVANENATEMSKILKQKCEDYKTKIA